MITLICKCGHTREQHACDPSDSQSRHHTGGCYDPCCECEAFEADPNKTRYDTSLHRHKAMMDRKDLQ